MFVVISGFVSFGGLKLIMVRFDIDLWNMLHFHKPLMKSE